MAKVFFRDPENPSSLEKIGGGVFKNPKRCDALWNVYEYLEYRDVARIAKRAERE